MVLLTITPAIVVAIQKCQELDSKSLIKLELPSEPSLAEPEAGDPISHSQLIGISKLLKSHSEQLDIPHHLGDLLRGSKVYIPPAKPKPEPVSNLLVGSQAKYVTNTRRPPNTKPSWPVSATKKKHGHMNGCSTQPQ